jgi:hypothetical protein
LGLQGLHAPATQYGVPLGQATSVEDDPLALQVTTLLPSHITVLGEQTWSLHVAVGLSQYWLAPQVSRIDDDKPSSAQRRTFEPEQASLAGSHTCGLHSPSLQVLLAPQTVPPSR